MTETLDPSAASDPVACPQCRGALVRIPRRFSERLVSLFTPLRRYRCPSHTCGWEGNLRQSRAAPTGADAPTYASDRSGPESSRIDAIGRSRTTAR
jgi:hypothetical protein